MSKEKTKKILKATGETASFIVRFGTISAVIGTFLGYTSLFILDTMIKREKKKKLETLNEYRR